MEEVLNFVKAFGVGIRHPHDEFLKEANDDCQPLKSFGICDFDDEDFYHKPYPTFSCHIPGCRRTFDTVIQFEAHYNSCHCFTCKECKKNLPNYHFLDLHISESHDSFFIELAKRKPMFRCFLEECKECFRDPQERREHCISVHKFPSDFRFDYSRKKTGHKEKPKQKIPLREKMDIVETSEDSNHQMDISEAKEKTKQNMNFKGFSFGRNKGKRKPIFHNFSKDLMNSLPET